MSTLWTVKPTIGSEESETLMSHVTGSETPPPRL